MNMQTYSQTNGQVLACQNVLSDAQRQLARYRATENKRLIAMGEERVALWSHRLSVMESVFPPALDEQAPSLANPTVWLASLVTGIGLIAFLCGIGAMALAFV